jgi:type II secretory pathway pseudopilin PulG
MTLVELLVAVAMAGVIMIAVASFFWQTTRAWIASNTQIAMQRQGTLVQQEFSRVVLASNGVLPGICGPAGNVASLPLRVPAGTLPESGSGQQHICFYWAANPGPIVQCPFNPAVNTLCSSTGRDLLAGDPTNQTIRATAVTFSVVNNSVVDFEFTLEALDGANVVFAGPLRFATRAAIRN